MYQRLTFIFELASNFISAHEDVDILELLNEGPVAYQLALEKNRQLEEARATLSQQLPVFPELARSLKTQVRRRLFPLCTTDTRWQDMVYYGALYPLRRTAGQDRTGP